jgi:AcrR family transcriptional regulator
VPTTTGPRRPSFIEAARRAQLVEAAIAVVNEVGYAQTSLSRIAAAAGTSKSVVSYHFSGKEELLRLVVEEVFEATGTVMAEAVEAQSTWPGKLEAYVRAELGEMARHPQRFAAATEILISHRDDRGRPLLLDDSAADLDLLESVLRGGVAEGAFRPLPDVGVAATMITHAVDGGLTALQRDPATDLGAYADALVPLLLAAVEAR